MITMWRVQATLGGGNYADVFLNYRAARKWADDLCVAYGWDYERGDRLAINQTAVSYVTQALAETQHARELCDAHGPEGCCAYCRDESMDGFA